MICSKVYPTINIEDGKQEIMFALRDRNLLNLEILLVLIYNTPMH